MAKVGIVMGSDSDLGVMSKAAEMLEKFGIEYEMTVISAHRMPDVFFDYYRSHLDARSVQPNAAHRILAQWERDGRRRRFA